MYLKPIKDYEGLYEISDKGEVFSCERVTIIGFNGKRLHKKSKKKFRYTQSGYFQVTLCKNSIKKTFRVARLVAEAFIPNPQNKPTVNHKDGNKLNNYADNLEWANYSEQLLHAYKNNLLDKKGEKNSMAKLTKEQVLKIRELCSTKKEIQKNIAFQFNISPQTLSDIFHNRTWKNL